MISSENIVHLPPATAEAIPPVEVGNEDNIIYLPLYDKFAEDTLPRLRDMRIDSKCFNNVVLPKEFGEFKGEVLSVFSSAAYGAHEPGGTWTIGLFGKTFLLSTKLDFRSYELYVKELESVKPADKHMEHTVMSVLNLALVLDETNTTPLSTRKPSRRKLGGFALYPLNRIL